MTPTDDFWSPLTHTHTHTEGQQLAGRNVLLEGLHLNGDWYYQCLLLLVLRALLIKSASFEQPGLPQAVEPEALHQDSDMSQKPLLESNQEK